MRKVLLALALLACSQFRLFAQDNRPATGQKSDVADTLKPYQKFPSVPAFNILEIDSSTVFNTYNIPEGKPVAIMFFSPDCKHCKATMKKLIKGWDSVSNVQFYMVTAFHDFGMMRDFYKEHHLADHKNVRVIGRDYEFFYGSFYGISVVPDIALYDEHKKLVHLIQGETTASEIYKYVH